MTPKEIIDKLNKERPFPPSFSKKPVLYRSKLIEYEKKFGSVNRSKIEDLFNKGLVRTVSVDSVAIDCLRLNEERFMALMEMDAPSTWITKWFELWPKGIKSG